MPAGAGGRDSARQRRIRLVSSLAFTGLLRCTQPPSAISRNVSVEMSPVRMMAGTS